MLKHSAILLASLVCGALLIGCGGSVGPETTSKSKQYSDVLNRAYSATGSMTSFASGVPLPTAGVPKKQSVVAEISAKLKTSSLKSSAKAPVSTRSLQGEKYFDEIRELWVRIDVDNSDDTTDEGLVYKEFAASYFLDEALTNPAGSLTFGSSTEGSSQISDYRDEVTAGKYAGTLITARSIQNSVDGSYSTTFEYRLPVEGMYTKGEMSFNPSTGEYLYGYTTRFDDGAEVSVKATLKNGDFSYEVSDSTGYSVYFLFRNDGSGMFRISGQNDPLLPAVGEWNTDGKGIVTYADGSTEEFDLNSGEGFSF